MRGGPKSAPSKRPSLRQPDTKADMALDKKRGIAEGSPQDEGIDAQVAKASPASPVGQQMPHPPAPSGGSSPAHAAMATSIAHAILQGGKGGGY